MTIGIRSRGCQGFGSSVRGVKSRARRLRPSPGPETGVATLSSVRVSSQTPSLPARARLDEIASLIDKHLADPASSWSVGEFGVLAEFHHTALPVAEARTVLAAGGALRVGRIEGARVLAYETPSPNPRLWNHGVAFCLPEETARMNCRGLLTELGPDHEAIQAGARGETLFDLGLGRRTMDFCLRTGDPALISVLRSACGAAWADRPDLQAAVIGAGPTRVVISRIARIEVSNPIPRPGGVSPAGPHTHLLPGLMRSGRTHNASIPVPAGFQIGRASCRERV